MQPVLMEEHVCHLTHALVGLDGWDLHVVNVSCDVLAAEHCWEFGWFLYLVCLPVLCIQYSITYVHFMPFVQHIAHQLVRMVVCVLDLLHVNAYLDGLDPVVLMVRLCIHILYTLLTVVNLIATILYHYAQ